MNEDPQPTIWTPERQAIAKATAQAWLGTPHYDRMAKKGVGVDCIRFVGEILLDAGICPPFTWPGYTTRTGLGRSENIMERLLLRTLHSRVIGETDPWEFGDLIIFEVGRQSNHIGIWLGERIWHSQARQCVEPIVASPRMLATVQSVMRITATGFREDPANITPEDFAP